MRSVLIAALAALPLAGGAQPGTPADTVYAEPITAENFTRALRGPGADAGIGDWMFSNGTLCASVSAPEHETYLSARGGSLIDLGYCGRDDDQWSAYHDLINLSREQVLGASEVSAHVTGEAATIRVRGTRGGIEVETRYTLARALPEELAIETTVRRVADADALSLFGSLVLHTHRGLTPFVVSTTDPRASKGFRHPFVDTNDRIGMTRLLFPADLNVMVGPASGAPEISYGLLSQAPEHVDDAGERAVLRQFSIDNQDFSLVGTFSAPLWFDTDAQPGLLQLAQVPLMDLAVGEALHIRRRLLVSARADVASVTDRVYTGATLRGQAGGAADRVLVSDAEGHPLSFVKPAADGSFALRLPAGISRARLVLNTPFREAAQTLPAEANGPVVRFTGAPALAQLELPAHGMPMRLVFKGRDGTADPLFGSDLRGFQVGERVIPADPASNGVSLTGTAADPGTIELPAGEYRVFATRGPEYTLEKADLRVAAGERARLVIAAPRRAFATRHWLAADFHVHGEFSFDSTLPARARIADFVAQGGEVLVVSEHKRLVDYQPIVEEMGLAEALVTLTGTELTGIAHGERIERTIGHANVFPLRADPLQFQGGVLPHENRRPGEVIAAHKQRDPRVVFQLNHPRKAGDTVDEGQFFNHLAVGRAYDPSQPLQSEANRSLIETLPGTPYRDIDFDALEVLNGTDFTSYPLLRADWFSFLLQGQRKLATGNSDSHSARVVVAMPRNYVRLKDARADAEGVARFDTEGFLESIHAGRMFASSGPLLEVRLDGKGLGRTVRGHEATLTVRIRAADWVPVERLRVLVNGEVVREAPASRHGTHELSLTFARDSFLVVEVEGTASGAYRAVYPGLTPFAVTNPIWIDADGDGQWTPPGLTAKK